MKFVPKSVTRNIGRKVLTTKMNSPHIFFAAGIVGIVGATVMACRATLKLEDTLDEIEKDLVGIPEWKDIETESREVRLRYYKDVGTVAKKATIDIVKLYGPAVVVGGISIAALTGSHVQLTRRNTALSATLAATMKMYEAYRERVAQELGEKRELEIYRGIHDDAIEMDGHKKELVKVTDPNAWSIYTRVFDESNINWRRNAEFNRIFIQAQQNYLNHQLQARGHVFLNEVYDHLGFPRSRAGSVVGWVVDGDGDGFIDFGLFEARSRRFINGAEQSIILDFNVDGVIYDKLKEE